MPKLDNGATMSVQRTKINHLFDRGQINLASEYTMPLTSSFTKILGTYSDNKAVGFIGNGNELIENNGGGADFSITGTSNLALLNNIVTKIIYSLHINGFSVGEETEQTFQKNDDYKTMAISGFLAPASADSIEVWAKAIPDNSIIIKKLNVILKGI